MASQTVIMIEQTSDYVEAIVSDLNQVLDRLDAIGFTEAGAKLASVLDWLQAYVSDVSESGQATQS